MKKNDKKNDLEMFETETTFWIPDTNTLFVGDRSVLFAKSKEELKKLHGDDNLNLFEVEKLNLSVSDIRQMISSINKRSEHKKYVLLSSFYWSDEVQNAMLKVLEETPTDTVIYLFATTLKTFLPTILSRVQTKQAKSVNRFLKDAEEILLLEPNERLENKKVKKILSMKVVDINYLNGQENEKKDREAHLLFLGALLEIVLMNRENLELERGFLEKILQISVISDIEGGSPHLFVEWLLLAAPRIG